jgi:cytochrome P450
MIDLYEPDTYVDGPPHAVFEHLRETDPVHWQDMGDGTGYWAVLRHADVVHVARHPNLFSASLGGVVLEDLDPDALAMMRHMLLAMDPPAHPLHRQPLAPSFTARVIGRMEGQVRRICRQALARPQEQHDVEFVHEICSLVPSQVIGELMGLPEDDWPRIHRWAEQQTGGQDAEVSGEAATASPSVEMAMYAIGLAGRRRQDPRREDLTSLILASDFGDGPMTDVDFGAFFVQLVTAGNDTTKTMLSSGALALVSHPDQLADLRADPSLIPSAVEEILRWANPLHYFRRTATEDAEVSGTTVRAGEKLAMVYTSANRDGSVFDDPHRFDMRREPNPHLSFGIGTHFCLGAHLARLEAKVFFEELLATFGTIELTGPPRRIRSNLNNGLKELPLHLA